MAIKGKSKSRGGSKTVTRGPKPSYVPVKRPLLARSGFWWVTLAAVTVLAVAGLWYGFARQASQDRAKELEQRKRTAATTYQGQVEPILQTVGQATQPGIFQVVTGFEQSLSDFIDGKGDAKQLEGASSGAQQVLKTAAAALGKVDPAQIVRDKDLSRDLVLYFVNSQQRMTQALRLYEQAAVIAGEAAKAEGDEAAALGASAKATLDIANGLFADGYADYVEVQVLGGIYQPQLPSQPVLPGQPGPPTGPTGSNP